MCVCVHECVHVRVRIIYIYAYKYVSNKHIHTLLHVHVIQNNIKTNAVEILLHGFMGMLSSRTSHCVRSTHRDTTMLSLIRKHQLVN